MNSSLKFIIAIFSIAIVFILSFFKDKMQSPYYKINKIKSENKEYFGKVEEFKKDDESGNYILSLRTSNDLINFTVVPLTKFVDNCQICLGDDVKIKSVDDKGIYTYKEVLSIEKILNDTDPFDL